MVMNSFDDLFSYMTQDDARFFSTAPRLSRSWPFDISWSVALRPPQTITGAANLFTPASLHSRGVCNAYTHMTITLLEAGKTFFPGRKARCELFATQSFI